MVFSRLILGFIVSKEGKIPNPKKVQVIVNMLVPTNPLMYTIWFWCTWSTNHVSGRITRWLLFLKYEFTIVYKLRRTHVVVDVLSKLLDKLEQLGVPN
jgi:hypothetical protein